jgi:3-(3-hydroxy-phenyl)propionate hydroxylase
MASLITHPNLPHPDDIYGLLIGMHHECDDGESHKRNAMLILSLANHIGDEAVVRQAIALVKQTSKGQS